jgi:superfamily II DNA or RNA helicase
VTKDLREHQVAALNSIVEVMEQNSGSATGRIVIPTGGGKTFIEAALIDYQIRNRVSGYTAIHLVLAPRILLANQLITEYRKYGGIHYRSIAFHSGKHEPDYEIIKWQEKSTTSVSELEAEFIKAQKVGTDLVVFSTYHSCDKLANIKFDTIIADESQYCVSENFNNAIKSLTGRVKVFFTATERHTSSTNGRGLNNENIYGKRLYTVKPAELITKNLIVPPRLHIMHALTRCEGRSVVDEVIELAQEQDKLTRPELGFSKILFAMKGTADVKTVADNLAEFQNKFPGHDIFTITSKTGAQINGIKIRREDFVERLKNAKNALIFHYDILSEGIDVDGITGVVLMRQLLLAKLLQTIGRAVRIYKPDPSLKRQAWISVPVLNGEEDDMAQVREVIRAIRDGGYDISKEHVVETGNTRHHGDEQEINDAYGSTKPNLSLFSIEVLFHEIEKDAYWDAINTAETPEETLDLLFS